MIEYSIIIKKLNNSLSKEEEIQFSTWLNSSSKNRSYFKKMEKSWKEDENKDINVDSAIENFDHFVDKFEKTNLHIYIKRIVYSAAVVTLLISLSILLGEKPEKPTHFKKYIAKNQIVPGSKKAVIIANDSIIYLNNKTNNSKIIVKGDTIHNSEGMVSYKGNNKDNNKNSYSTIVVPRGGEYSLQLADGTKVYLNADSKLKFPTYFNSKERRVILNGEAYFEVAHNSNSPFIVQTRLGNTKVYGTKFDVKCYDDEKVEKVTLVTGKIGYSSNDFKGEAILKPGEQISYCGNVRKPIPYKVDIENVILWKENKLKFRKATLEEIMTILSRWYDFEVKYQNDGLKKLIFTGRLNKYEDINTFLSLFKETTKIEFDVVDKTIFVRQRY